MTRREAWAGALLMAAWFALAAYVLTVLLVDAEQVFVVVAAWAGGVLSVYAATLLVRLVRPGPVTPTR